MKDNELLVEKKAQIKVEQSLIDSGTMVLAQYKQILEKCPIDLLVSFDEIQICSTQFYCCSMRRVDSELNL